MRDPLLAPFVALAGGVVAARYVPFSTRELVCALAALAVLLAFGSWKRSRRGTFAAGAAALFFAGAWAAQAHRPGLAPELDAGAREVVVLSGCVVEPTV
ncbi:MAG TPA: hypothetical protein VF767_02330, partial [Bryobacteraceae bacterium]